MNRDELVVQYLDRDEGIGEPIREVLDALRESGPRELARAVDPTVAKAVKEESTSFLLFVIERALDDNVKLVPRGECGPPDFVAELKFLDTKRVGRVELNELVPFDLDASTSGDALQ